MVVLCMLVIGIGISSTISISNTRKIIIRRKNRNENGVRALCFGSNPHSNGDFFSESAAVRVLIIKISASNKEVIIEAIVVI